MQCHSLSDSNVKEICFSLLWFSLSTKRDRAYLAHQVAVGEAVRNREGSVDGDVPTEKCVTRAPPAPRQHLQDGEALADDEGRGSKVCGKEPMQGKVGQTCRGAAEDTWGMQSVKVRNAKKL